MESKKKMLFIFNPFSGKAQIKSKLFEIIDVFVKGGYEVIVHPTQAVGDGFEKTKELAPQVDLVVCSGGDGTLDGSCQRSDGSGSARSDRLYSGRKHQ